MEEVAQGVGAALLGFPVRVMVLDGVSELLAKGMDTCTCMVESLRCSPETITALLTGYTPSTKKKKSKKKIQTQKKRRICCQGRGHLFPVSEAPKMSKCHKIWTI